MEDSTKDNIVLDDINIVERKMPLTHISIHHLLKGDKIYKIPDFQRFYVWGNENVTQLIRDILYTINKNKKWFVSNFLIKEETNVKYLIIDGQQRITTIFLILFYLKKLLEETILCEKHYEIMKADTIKIINDHVKIEGVKSEKNKLKLNIDNLNKKLENIYENWNNSKKMFDIACKSIETELNNHLTKFNNDNNNYILEIKKIVFACLNLRINKIVLPKKYENEYNEYLIFESLNSKGKSLSFIELLKNYFWKEFEFDDKEKEKKFKSDLNTIVLFFKNEVSETKKTNWINILYEEKSSAKGNFENILSDIISLRFRKNVEPNKYKKENDIEKYQKLNLSLNESLKKNPKIIMELYEYVKNIKIFYEFCFNYFDEISETSLLFKNDDKEKYSKLFFILSIGKILPFFMFTIIEQVNIKKLLKGGNKAKEDFWNVINILEKYVVQRYLSEVKNWVLPYYIEDFNKLNKINNNFIQNIIDNLFDQNKFVIKKELLVSDEDYILKNTTKIHDLILRYVLIMLNNTISKNNEYIINFIYIKKYKNKKSIWTKEHIIPKDAFTKMKKEPERFNKIADKQDYLGNLSLLYKDNKNNIISKSEIIYKYENEGSFLIKAILKFEEFETIFPEKNDFQAFFELNEINNFDKIINLWEYNKKYLIQLLKERFLKL